MFEVKVLKNLTQARSSRTVKHVILSCRNIGQNYCQALANSSSSLTFQPKTLFPCEIRALAVDPAALVIKFVVEPPVVCHKHYTLYLTIQKLINDKTRTKNCGDAMGKLGKIIGWLPHLSGWRPSSEKSWIRHCIT